MRVKFGNSTKDVSILEVTKDNYIVPRGEENTYHCRIEQTQFSPRNGKRLSKPFIQKFDAKMYPALVRNLKQQGWDIVVLYDPTEYLAEQERKRKEAEEMTFKQRMEAEEAKKQAERNALKAEILAELKAGGFLKDDADVNSDGKGKGDKEPKTKGGK